MKKTIILIIISSILISCKSSKAGCDAYGSVKSQENQVTDFCIINYDNSSRF
jgi:hypothetical protein